MKIYIKKYGVAAAIIILFFLLNYRLLSFDSSMVFIKQASVLGFGVLGAGIIALCDSYILSSGAQIALAGLLAVYFNIKTSLPLWLAIISMLSVAMLLGVLTSRASSAINLHIIIFSLALGMVLGGINSTIGNNLGSVRIYQLTWLVSKKFLGIPFVVYLFALTAVLVWLFINWTNWGRAIIAVGENREACERAGLPVNTVRAVAYAVGFLLIGACGIIILAQTTIPSSTTFDSRNFDLVCALSLGAVSFRGGKGGVGGMVLGTIAVIMLNALFTLSNISFLNADFIKGCLILLMLKISN